MAPLIEVSENYLKELNPKKYIRRDDLEDYYSNKNLNDFIYVPSINLYVAKQRIHLGKNWFDSHKLLQEQESRMLIIPEFIEFLKYVKKNHQEIYKDITEVRTPRRSEWLDADFKIKDEKLHINYNHVLDSNGNLVPKNSELLDSDTLMQDKIPGINLEDFLNSSHTNQGLPAKKVKSGELYYWYPRSDNNSVARFFANGNWVNLNSFRGPSLGNSYLGVRAVKEEK